MKSSLVDRFWCLRCLNNLIHLPDMTGSFTSGSDASLLAKIGAKPIILLPSIKSSLVDRFWCLRCLYDYIDEPDMM